MARIFGPAGPGYRTAALAAALGLGIAAVTADARAADTGWYFGVQVPVMFIDDTESKTKGNQILGLDPRNPTMRSPYEATATSEYDAGFKFAGVLGYELGGGLRVEGELFFARAKVDKITYGGVSAVGNPIPGLKLDVPISGAAKQFGGFASLFYDFRTDTDWIPFIGGGIGFIRVDQGDLDYDANRLVQGTLTAMRQNPASPLASLSQQQFEGLLNNISVPEISTTDTMFAYHIGAGIGYRLNEKTTLQFGYRLQTGSGLKFSGRNAAGTVKVDTDMRAHLFEIGFRIRF